MIKVIEFKKLKSGKKKYQITFIKNGKKYIRKFGAAGMSDFTIHKDKTRRNRYISRHKKDLKTRDPMKPGYLSMYILWNKPSIQSSLKDYKRRLGVYNRKGKFPLEIEGSKFGSKQKVIDKMRQNMYNQIMSTDDVEVGLKLTIEKLCKRGFNDIFCQGIFTELLLSIYYTIVKNSNITNKRKENISEMDKFVPQNFTPTKIKINRSQFNKINTMLYSLQDHTYGTFKNARVASLIYEYIHFK